MLIENLTRLVGGELKNKPKISQVDGFCIDCNSVKKADAFIAINCEPQDIKLAINNGAYAIIYGNDLDICMSEIAFIKVDNLSKSLFRLMRFLALQKQIKFIGVNLVQKSILKCLYLPKNLSELGFDLHSIFLNLNKAGSGDTFFSDNLCILKKINENYELMGVNADIKPIVMNSIFFTNIVCADTYYQNLIFPYLFVADLSGVIEFLKKHSFDVKFKDLMNFDHFRPIFVDKFFRIKPFGRSYRAFIVESDFDLFCREARFLKSKFDDVLICAMKDKIPANYDLSIDIDFYLTDINDIKQIKEFRYALILCEFNDLQNCLQDDESSDLFL